MTARKKRPLTGRDVFGEGGLCARGLPDYEHRPEQERMMEAVTAAIAHDDACLVEAGTGVGKTLAYLVPAIQSGRKVVVATGTRALMEQVRRQDVPFLIEHLPHPFTVAVLKGRANYVCPARMRDQWDLLGGTDPHRDRRTLAHIRQWMRRTETGDIAELTDLPEGSAVLHRVVSTSETCPGRPCPDFAACFLFRARERALQADLVITNHHLFFSDLALQEDGGTRILPEDAVVILDEAHALEGVATEHFGVVVRSGAVALLASDAQALAARGDPARSGVLATVAGRLAERFFEMATRLAGPDGRAPIQAGRVPAEVSRAWHDLEVDLEVLADEARTIAGEVGASNDVSVRARKVRDDLGVILGDADPSFVRVAERTTRSASLSALPVEVAGLLRERLFESGRPVVLVSATLTVDGSTAFLRARLGVPDTASEVVLASPYDFERQVLVYLPDGLPDPNDASFPRAFAEEALRVLQATRGRAFLLFTSHAALRRAYDLMRERMEWPVLVQGETARDEMIRRFKQTPHACLFGTHTFWEGVDVMGPALSCVIIDRLPFDPPDDPMLRARCERVEDRGHSAFRDYQLPLAVIRLRQGFGRLVRRRSDRGVVAIMDPRLRTKAYGKVFLRSLPPARACSDFEELEAWCRKHL